MNKYYISAFVLLGTIALSQAARAEDARLTGTQEEVIWNLFALSSNENGPFAFKAETLMSNIAAAIEAFPEDTASDKATKKTFADEFKSRYGKEYGEVNANLPIAKRLTEEKDNVIRDRDAVKQEKNTLQVNFKTFTEQFLAYADAQKHAGKLLDDKKQAPAIPVNWCDNYTKSVDKLSATYEAFKKTCAKYDINAAAILQGISMYTTIQKSVCPKTK